MRWLSSLANAWGAAARFASAFGQTGEGTTLSPRLQQGSILAKSLGRSIAFYQQVFSLRVRAQWTSMQLETDEGTDTLQIAGVWLEDQNGRVIEILENADPAKGRGEQKPINHIGFEVHDVRAMYKQALAAGAKGDTPPMRVIAGELKAHTAFVRGPDGERIELVRLMTR